MAMHVRHPALRWLVPVAAVVLLGVIAIPRAVADPTLPPKTAEELLVDVQTTEVTALSGTVETTADLGLPALPGQGAEVTALLSGTNTIRVWYDGDKSRATIVGEDSEASIIRNGDDVWQWSSESNTAHHGTVAAHDASEVPASSLTPQELAKQLLSEVEASTDISLAQNQTIAGRDAYELVLQPKSSDTLVGQVTIAIDGETYLPLRVQIFAADTTSPAIEIGFTEIDYSTPDSSVFEFEPATGVTVEEDDSTGHNQHQTSATQVAPVIVGEGWEQVGIFSWPATTLDDSSKTTDHDSSETTDHDSSESSDHDSGQSDTPDSSWHDFSDATQAEQWTQFLESLPAVEGDWGTGRALETALVTVVLTDDGRVAMGAVPTELVAAALDQ